MTSENSEDQARLPAPTAPATEALRALIDDYQQLLSFISYSIRQNPGEFNAYEQLLYQMTWARSVDLFLDYVTKLLSLIFRTRPETMRSGQMIRLDAVLRYQTMQELIESIAEEQVNSLSYKSVVDISKYLQEELNFGLFEHESDFREARIIVETRNLIVHNHAVVNRIALSKAPDYPLTPGQKITLTSRGVPDTVLTRRRARSAPAASPTAAWTPPAPAPSPSCAASSPARARSTDISGHCYERGTLPDTMSVK